jgi:hypothetical protein
MVKMRCVFLTAEVMTDTLTVKLSKIPVIIGVSLPLSKRKDRKVSFSEDEGNSVCGKASRSGYAYAPGFPTA